MGAVMGFVERGDKESLAEHLLKNAEVLGASTDQVTRLRYAFRLSLGTNAEKAEGGQVAVAVRDELKASMDALFLGMVGRGERVVTYNDAGAKQRQGGDGIAALLRTKALVAVQVKAALVYRQPYETLAKSLGSCLGRAGEGEAGRVWGNMPFYTNDEGELAIIAGAVDLHRAHLLVRLNRMERAVAKAMVDGRELRALRLIAGEGKSVREVAGSGGKASTLYREALQRGLDAIVEDLRISEHLGQ